MMSFPELLTQVSTLGISLVLTPDNGLKINAPKGTLTLELKRDLATHKDALIAMLQVEPRRKEIARLVLEESLEWEYSKELDPRWPPSKKIYKRLQRKDECKQG